MPHLHDSASRSVNAEQIDLHWIITASAGALLLAGFHFAGLPLSVKWGQFVAPYWVGNGARAIFAATLLYLIQFPLAETVKPVLMHYRRNLVRIPIFIIFAIGMILHFGVEVGVIFATDALVLAELMDRSGGLFDVIVKPFRSILWPAVYLFFGLVAMFCYNDLIASIKFAGTYDSLFLKLDSILLHGSSVSGIVHSATRNLPLQIFRFAEFIYMGMFFQIGAGLVFTALALGRRESFRYVGTILTAYALALLLFYLSPSMGPFYSCTVHSLPHVQLATYEYQQTIVLTARLLTTSYKHFNAVGTDYFIAFPCMHIAQPLVVLWFLRRWRVITYALILYDIILIPAILILEWHYLVDVMGGILVAGTAIGLTSISLGGFHRRDRNSESLVPG